MDSPSFDMLTEQINEATSQIDRLPTVDVLRLINAEDQKVAPAVAQEIPAIARAVDGIVKRMKQGGRLIYCGAGTSGRLGVLDASECPPTYGVSPDQVVGVIAGGFKALVKATEGAEDDRELARQDMAQIALTDQDTLIGVAASGRTPYVLSAMDEAREKGCLVIAFSCNPGSPMAVAADIAITPAVGPEAISGSTRMKAGTATKLVLNMVSTAVMIKLGKVYGNLMIDVKATNEKLRIRAREIVVKASGVSVEAADNMLHKTGYDVRLSVFALLSGYDPDQAKEKLEAAGNLIHQALSEINQASK